MFRLYHAILRYNRVSFLRQAKERCILPLSASYTKPTSGITSSTPGPSICRKRMDFTLLYLGIGKQAYIFEFFLQLIWCVV